MAAQGGDHPADRAGSRLTSESRDLTRGSLGHHIRRLAPAAVTSQLLLSSFEMVDAYWTGRLEEGAAGLA